MKTNTRHPVRSRFLAPQIVSALVWATVLVPSSPAASFGNVAEEALYAGAALPLFYVGVFAGVGVAAAGAYIGFDVGEAFYFGLRESALALQGGGPEDWADARISRNTALGRKIDDHANLGMEFNHGTEMSRQLVDIALDPRFQVGDSATDIWGFRLGLLSAVDHDVYGLDICTLAGRTLGDEYGLQLGLFNLVDGEVGGIQAGLANVAGRSLTGLQIAGFFNAAAGIAPCWGLQVSGLMNRAHDFRGLQAAYVNVADQVSGLQLGGYAEAELVGGGQISFVCRTMDLGGFQIGAINVCLDLDNPDVAGDMEGVQIGVINICNHGSGLQLGVWNQARSFDGVQIGLCNVISEGPVPFLPIVNASF